MNRATGVQVERAGAASVTEDQLHDLTQFEPSPHFSEQEKLVLRLTVALTRTPAEVPDALFEALGGEFSERELVELNATIT